MNTSMLNIVTIDKETKQFIQDLQQSSFIPTICQPIEECVFAYVCGSRQTGLQEENSDFDIVTVAKNNQSREWTGRSLNYLTEDGKKIHVQWFPAGVESFFGEEDFPLNPEGLVLAGLFEWGYINEDVIFYRNTKYNYILQNFLQHKNQLMKLGAYKYSKKYLNVTLDQIEKSFTAVSNWLPTICRLSQISQALLSGNPFNNKEILKDIKRGRNLEQHYDFMLSQLKKLKLYIDNNPLDIELETRRLIDLMYEGGMNYARAEKNI